MHTQGVSTVVRILRKPPGIIVQRMMAELVGRTDRFLAPRRARGFDNQALLALTDASSLEQLSTSFFGRNYAVPLQQITELDYERARPRDGVRIISATKRALVHRVHLLGYGLVDLGSRVDWHTDFKTGESWPPAFMRDITYTNLDRSSDVKVPWELSRLQWLMPARQAYLLTGDERYASTVRVVLDDWMASNPYAQSVNWTCTMEVAMRTMSGTWFFHVFCRSRAWSDETFQSQFLRALYLRGAFTERYLERSDINGNHFTADAVGLVFVGLFFGQGVAPRQPAHPEGRFHVASSTSSATTFAGHRSSTRFLESIERTENDVTRRCSIALGS